MSMDVRIGGIGTIEAMLQHEDDTPTQYTNSDVQEPRKQLRDEALPKRYVVPKKHRVAAALIDVVARIREERMNPTMAEESAIHRASQQTAASIDTSRDFTPRSIELPGASHIVVSQSTESDPLESADEPVIGVRTRIQNAGQTILQGVSEMFKTHRPAVVGGLAVAAVIATAVAAPVARSIIRRTP